MFPQTLRASRLGAVRVARQHAVSCRRTFVATTIRQADIVQDLYVKALKDYKTPAVKASDADAHVHKFSSPAVPKSPEESNLAGDLQAYESQTVEVEGSAGTPSGETAAEPKWFEDEEDWKDFDKEEEHH